MREVDRLMVEDVGIDLIRMMENAGPHLAALAIDLFAPARVAVLAGPGGNGGGGLTAARHLSNRGVEVDVILSHPEDRLAPVPAEQLAILHRMGVAIPTDPPAADLLLDALIGSSPACRAPCSPKTGGRRAGRRARDLHHARSRPSSRSSANPSGG